MGCILYLACDLYKRVRGALRPSTWWFSSFSSAIFPCGAIVSLQFWSRDSVTTFPFHHLHFEGFSLVLCDTFEFWDILGEFMWYLHSMMIAPKKKRLRSPRNPSRILQAPSNDSLSLVLTHSNGSIKFADVPFFSRQDYPWMYLDELTSLDKKKKTRFKWWSFKSC